MGRGDACRECLEAALTADLRGILGRFGTLIKVNDGAPGRTRLEPLTFGIIRGIPGPHRLLPPISPQDLPAIAGEAIFSVDVVQRSQRMSEIMKLGGDADCTNH